MTTNYPLSWPDHIARSKTKDAGRFKASIHAALNNVRTSLRLFGNDSGKKVADIIVSSNYSLTDARPDDAGVAVWFTWDNAQICIPVDRYSTIEGNLQAIHHIIEARRTELRHGTLALVRATFRGFQALPPPPGAAARQPWRDVLGLGAGENVSVAAIDAAYRRQVKTAHPDNGGSTAEMVALTRARDEARSELGKG